MVLPSIDNIDVDIIKFINKAKENGGYLMAEDLNAHVFNNLAKRKMIQHGLIIKSADKDWQYDLTEKGWKFSGFKSKQLNYEKWTFWIGVVVATLLTIISILLSLRKS
jgi:predicted transcriptional regulator